VGLVGGSWYGEGNVFAYNPDLHLFGPVCGHSFEMAEVKIEMESSVSGFGWDGS
jgi:hypothetical protein